MGIHFEKGINEQDASRVCQWSNARGRDFQEQWMGAEVSYPLNDRKLQGLPNVYSIYHDDEFLGMIQQVRVQDHNIHLGRFILNPARAGQGYGKQSLIEFVKLCFRENAVQSVSLNVYDDNQVAKNLYIKAGFEIEEIIKEPGLKYRMKKYR